MSYGANPLFKVTYTPTKQTDTSLKYASNLIKSEYDRYGTNLGEDLKKIIDGGCKYLPNFVCSFDDLDYFNKIKGELVGNAVNWSKHQKYEDPKFSPTFNFLVKKVSEHFNVTPVETRLNYYRNGTDWKPYHHDSHAYRNTIKENFTIGISLGATRELSFLHDETGNKFSFPQNNGDVFAFDKEINKKFMHGVPKKSMNSCGERISIIMWCKDN